MYEQKRPLAPTAQTAASLKWVAVVLAALTVLGPLSMDLYLPVLPDLADSLSTSSSAAQLTMTACLLGLALGQIVAGPLSDRFGRRAPVLGGLVAYTIASIGCAVSGSIAVLVGFRLLQGLAGGVVLVISQAAGRDLYEGPRLNRYYGRIVVLSGLAAVLAPVIGGVLTNLIQWRGFFVLLAVIGALLTFVIAISFTETLPADRRSTGGARRTVQHFRELSRDRLFVGATISSSLSSAVYFAYLAGAPFVLQNIYGLSPVEYAIVLGINAAGFALFGFSAGRSAERFGEQIVFAVGLGMLTVGSAVLASTFFAEVPLWATVTGFLAIASGAAAVSPPSTTLALSDYPQYAGTASAVLGLARFSAGAVAAPLVGLGGGDHMTALAAVALIGSLAAIVAYLLFVARAGRRSE